MKIPNITTDFNIKRTVLIAVAGGVLVLGVGGMLALYQRPTEELSCITEETSFQVQGESLSGIASAGSPVRVRWGFYECNTPKKGEITAVKFAGGTSLRVVQGLPGQAISWEQSGDSWRLLLDERVLMSSSNEPYVFTSGDKELLTMSLEGGTRIPQGAYLLLPSFADMRREKGFGGVVRREDILANIQLNQ